MNIPEAVVVDDLYVPYKAVVLRRELSDAELAELPVERFEELLTVSRARSVQVETLVSLHAQRVVKVRRHAWTIAAG